jgi:hypothetical protein
VRATTAHRAVATGQDRLSESAATALDRERRWLQILKSPVFKLNYQGGIGALIQGITSLFT